MTTDLADGPAVAGEPSELREVLTNLILNALDAMSGGGTLHLATQAGVVPGEVHLTVRDDGGGMSDEVRVRIFDPFFTTKGVRGVGLGLSVVYGIVQRHGGRIEVTSVPGEGTTMRVALPVAAPGLVAAAAPATTRSAYGHTNGTPAVASPPAPSAAGPALRVLVIDDEPGVRSLLADVLRAAGHDVVAVASGREGLAVLEDPPGGFDLVLSDLGMPDMSGWDVARAVQALPAAPPVVLVTGWGIQLDDQLLAASGVCEVIAKPFSIEDVLAVAVRAAARRAA